MQGGNLVTRATVARLVRAKALMLGGREPEALAACQTLAVSLHPLCLGRHLHHEAHKLAANTALAIATALRTPDLVSIVTTPHMARNGFVSKQSEQSEDATTPQVQGAAAAQSEDARASVASTSTRVETRHGEPTRHDGPANDGVGDGRAVHAHPFLQPRVVPQTREERKAAKREEIRARAPRGHAPPTMWQGRAAKAPSKHTKVVQPSKGLDGPVATVAKVVTIDPVYASVVHDLRDRWALGTLTDDGNKLPQPLSPRGNTRSERLRREGIIAAHTGLAAVATILSNPAMMERTNAAEYAEVLELQSALLMCTCKCIAADVGADNVARKGEQDTATNSVASDEDAIERVDDDDVTCDGCPSSLLTSMDPVCECGAVAAAVEALYTSVAAGGRDTLDNVCNKRRPQLDREMRLRELLDRLGLVRFLPLFL